MLSRFVIITLCVGMTFAATWIGRTPKKPKEFENVEGCYIKEINNVIGYGKTITPPGHCYRIACDGGMIDYASCGIVMSGDPKCHVTEEDLSKPYPDCCAGVKCDLDNNID